MRKRMLSVVLALAAWPVSVSAQVRVGPEFQVNGYTTDFQGGSHVAVDAAGNFLVVWHSSEQDGSSTGVFARWFGPDGVPLGAGEFRVNAATLNQQWVPVVASAPDGGMVVAWGSGVQDGSAYGIYARRYASAEAAPGPEFLVNAYTTGEQDRPSIAADAAGNFVVVWRGAGPGDSNGVFGRRFDASASPRGPDFRVNSYTTAVQSYPVVASDAAGNFVVVWESSGQDGSGTGVFAQRYDSTGSPAGGEFRVNTFTTGVQSKLAVASDPAGNFVVVWTSNQDGTSGVWARRYDPAGVAQSDAFRVSFATTQFRPAVASDAEGGFVVVWDTRARDGSAMGLFGRRYDSSGVGDPSPFAVNVHTTDDQTFPAVATDTRGDFVVTWMSAEQDGSSYGVFAQRFHTDLIFRDGFEDGTLGAWSSASADGGDLAVSTLAGMRSSTAGLQGVVDDTAGLYVEDDRPRDERRYRARFYFDPNGFDPGEAQSHRRTRIFLAFSDAPVRRVLAIVLRRLDGQYAIRGRARLDDNRQAETAFIPITDEPHVIELDLRSSSTPSSLTGQLVLSIDGEPTFLLALDNNLAEVDFVRMGALSVKAGANGTMYWDEFESRRQMAIGP